MPASFTSTLSKSFVVYALSNALKSGIPFYLLPLLTRYFSPEEYGMIATFEVLLVVMAIIVNLNMNGAIAVNAFKLDDDELDVYLVNALFIVCVSFILTFSLVYLMRGHLSRLLSLPEAWLPVIVIVALFEAVSAIVLTLWQVKQRAMMYGVFQISQSMLNVGLSLFFVMVLGLQWQGRLLAILVGSIVFGLVGLSILIKTRRLKLVLKGQYLRRSLAFGVPLVPHALGRWTMGSVDRVFINSMVGLSATGLYSVGVQIGMIVSLVATSFNQAWAPFVFEQLRDGDVRRKRWIVRFTYLYLVGIFGFAIAVILATPWLLSVLVGSRFQASYEYVPWIALGYAANGMYFMVANYILWAERTYLLAWLTIGTAGLNMLLNYVLIAHSGPVGAAQATAASLFVGFVVAWVVSAKVYSMPWAMWRPTSDVARGR